MFERLCQAAGLDVARVEGYGRGFGYRPGDRHKDLENHAWKAVKVDGEWMLVDSTRGAGYIDDTTGS